MTFIRKHEEVSVETLRSLVDYDPNTGQFTWRSRTDDYFGTDIKGRRCHKNFTTRFAGKHAFTAKTANGYFQAEIEKRGLLAHRAAWAHVHGVWPAMLDHINHDRSDNRIANLRIVTSAENQRNLSGAIPGKVMGVNWYARYGAWQVMIGDTHLGRFKDYDEAVRVRRAAEAERGFHPNHGKFLRADGKGK